MQLIEFINILLVNNKTDMNETQVYYDNANRY